jgi:hypothetical protein
LLKAFFALPVFFLPKLIFLDSLDDLEPFAIFYILAINIVIFIYMILSEQEKDDIRKKYEGNYSNEILTHLKRNHPVYEFNSKFMDSPIKQILVDDKLQMISKNKKYLVNKISSMLEDTFPSIEKSILRRTVKYYLDMLK